MRNPAEQSVKFVCMSESLESYTVSEQKTGTGETKMETESIVYFHPIQDMHKMAAAKRHWWEGVSLQANVLKAEDAGGFFIPVDCPVPPFYYKKRPWPQEILSEVMESVLHGAPGLADAYLHPQIMTLMSEDQNKRWEPRRETMERLAAGLLAACAAGCLYQEGRINVLLGRPEDTDWQMEMTRRLLGPYLPRINSLLFFYEEVEGSDIWEEMADELEAYGYEYGLVPGVRPYLTAEAGLRCDRERCGGVILDYADTPRYPRMEREGQTVYVDLASNPEKERSCIGKNGRILYISPIKYLDTIGKSRYDKKMYAKPVSGMKESGIELHYDRNKSGKGRFYHAGEEKYFNV